MARKMRSGGNTNKFSFDKTKKYHEWNKQIIENIKLFKSINNNNNNNGSTF